MTGASRIAALVAAWICIGVFAHPEAGRAAVFTVASEIDEPDALPGDGACSSTPAGLCTLRAAIQEANALPGRDQVLLGPGRYALVPGFPDEDQAEIGDLDIREQIEISGAGPGATEIAVDGNGRLFQVHCAADGAPPGPPRCGGSVALAGMLIAGGDGGSTAGGVDSLAGADLVLTDVVLLLSMGGNGGAISLQSGSLVLERSTVGGANAGAGGGIYNHDGALTIISSTISGNTSESLGGGIYSDGGSVTLTSSTISNNHAGTRGGAFFLWGGSSLTMDAATLAGNSADLLGSAIAIEDGAPSGVSISLSIVAGDCAAGPGQIVSDGYNLSNDPSCGLVGSTDIVAAVELLPLSAYGGPTETQPPLAGSPALDRAGSACPPADQRGVPRPQSSGPGAPLACDSGAVEAAADGDGDNVPDVIDVCAEVPDDQTDSAGLGEGSFPDGIGDACQCGDADDDGAVTPADVAALRMALAGATPLTAEGLAKCSVHGPGPSCDIVDGVVLVRALAASPLLPGIAQVCSAAGG